MDNKSEFKKYYDLAINHFNKRQFDLAKESIKQALCFYNDQDRNDEFYCCAAKIYSYNKEYFIASNYIDKAIEINPNKMFYYVLKGYSYQMLGKYPEAYDMYKFVLENARNNLDKTTEGLVLGYLSSYYCCICDYDKAKDAATKAIELGDKSGKGKRILNQYDYPKKVLPQTYIKYYKDEKCNKINEINHLKNELLKNSTIKKGEAGWILCSKTYNIRDFSVSRPVIEYHKTIYTLDVDGEWRSYCSFASDWSSYSINHNYFEREKTFDDSDFDKFLCEFDYEAYIRPNNMAYGEGVDYYMRRYESIGESLRRTNGKLIENRFIRLYKKGDGLYKALKKIKEQGTQPQYYSLSDRREDWQLHNKCSYCGGYFTGFFKKVCVECGKQKNY